MTATLSTQTTLPFDAAWGAGRHAALSKDGSLFLAVQSGLNGRVLRIFPDGRQAEITLAPQPTMRPTLHAGPWGLLITAGFDHDARTLLVWRVDDYVWPTDARVDGLAVQAQNQAGQLSALQKVQTGQAAQIAKLQQQIDALETALGNVSAGGLSEEDSRALDWVKRETRALEE